MPPKEKGASCGLRDQRGGLASGACLIGVKATTTRKDYSSGGRKRGKKRRMKEERKKGRIAGEGRSVPPGKVGEVGQLIQAREKQKKAKKARDQEGKGQRHRFQLGVVKRRRTQPGARAVSESAERKKPAKTL